MPTFRRSLSRRAASRAAPPRRPARRARPTAWPSKAVHIVVPFAPGGSGDITARLVGKYIEDKTGQPFVVENKAGANGIVGVLSVKSAPPDGYTLMLATTSTNAANVHMYKSPGYDPEKDFQVVGVIGSSGAFLVVPADSPYKSMADLIAYAKANPGKLNFGYFNASSQVPSAVLGDKAGRRLAGRRLQGDRQCLERPLCRRDPVHVRRPHGGARPGRGRQGAAAGDLAARAQPALSRRADAQRDLSRASSAPASSPSPCPRRCPTTIKQRLNALINEAISSPAINKRLIEEFALDATHARPRAVRRAGPRGARQVGGLREDRPDRTAVTGPAELAETNFRNFRKRCGILRLGVHPLGETAKLRTISRAKSLQGVSASFRRFPPRRAIVERAAISEGLEVSALSALSAARFAVSPKGCTPAQSPAWRMLSPAASSSAMSSMKTSGVVSAFARQSSGRRLRSQNMQALVSGGTCAV